MKKTRVLVIGPSRSASRGGMASVIQQEYDSPGLQEHLKMKFHASFKDGNLFSRIFYCMPANFYLLLENLYSKVLNIYSKLLNMCSKLLNTCSKLWNKHYLR